MTAVMRGVRILEVAEHTFTPLAAGILSDWGATVIKIEHVERGDAMRGLGSTGGVQVGGGGVQLLMEHANRGKQSLGLDLTTAQGRELLYRLAWTEWITGERFDSHEQLQANSGDARELVSAEFAQDTFENWKRRLKDPKGQWSPAIITLKVAGVVA